MNFWDVIRHLVQHGPFASDEEKQAALTAVDDHEAVHGQAVPVQAEADPGQ